MIDRLQSEINHDINGEHITRSTTCFPFHFYAPPTPLPLTGDINSKRKLSEMDRHGKS
jgi:hypothetical protein